ncbi:MAG: cysteine--tRNA ligase [Myxococcales bacterium]|jgi:cysteinyl-tRNA synthetase|nr:cysteine--tRNA ligase [Myxococcales bacterium]
MEIRVHNTMTGRKEPFVPIEAGRVGMYVCGPTVYDMSHVGHARVYVTFDVVARFLRSLGNEVRYVRNFTDLDDKIIRRANEQGVAAIDISERFIAEFQADMRALGVREADVAPKVTEHIAEIVQLIEKIVAHGHAYASGGDVYFAVRSFEGYGKLSKRNLDQLEAGARVEPGDLKRDPLDFALWKAAKPGEPAWPSPWGEGRPGWHIECSAMSAKYLGDTFDIHAGGKDLVFPHHENEIAQSEAASGKPFANYWLHNGFVQIDNEKMSKSLGNFFTIRDVLERCEAEALRYFLLGTHYRNPINFSDVALADAERRVDYLYETLAKVNERLMGYTPTEGPLLDGGLAEAIVPNFQKVMADDFNTAEALGLLAEPFALMNQLCEKPRGKKGADADRTLFALRAAVTSVGAILGLLDQDPKVYLLRRRARKAQEKGIEEALVETLIQTRTEARQAKDFAKADAVRAELSALGVELMDSPQGTTWKIA